uniref:Uncharacterized protein n=1 Tax=Utricularia reniformis TaxID=192314 RepID=A0A1Y0B2T0_9LAMI|nr:hypothetical protein AEK19_MT1506 [Utricularia reniformis]ART31697.1 hypothetical protein AEK19_MT1506 [Utricularia reniformis]
MSRMDEAFLDGIDQPSFFRLTDGLPQLTLCINP